MRGALLPNIKYFGNKIGIQFNNTPIVIEQNNYTSTVVYVYIVSDLDNWPKIPPQNFSLKKIFTLFGATNIVKANHKEKYGYSDYGIAFNGKGEWNFGNDSAWG